MMIFLCRASKCQERDCVDFDWVTVYGKKTMMPVKRRRVIDETARSAQNAGAYIDITWCTPSAPTHVSRFGRWWVGVEEWEPKTSVVPIVPHISVPRLHGYQYSENIWAPCLPPHPLRCTLCILVHSIIGAVVEGEDVEGWNAIKPDPLSSPTLFSLLAN